MGIITIRTRVITVEEIKAEAARRIEAICPMWMVARQITGGKPIPEKLKEEVLLIRKRSNELEEMSPIPDDYTNDRHWR